MTIIIYSSSMPMYIIPAVFSCRVTNEEHPLFLSEFVSVERWQHNSFPFRPLLICFVLQLVDHLNWTRVIFYTELWCFLCKFKEILRVPFYGVHFFFSTLSFIWNSWCFFSIPCIVCLNFAFLQYSSSLIHIFWGFCSLAHVIS